MIVIESTGRKVKDAIDKGLEKIGKSLFEVNVEILDNGGLFRKAKVRITAKTDDFNEDSVALSSDKEKSAKKEQKSEQKEHKSEQKSEYKESKKDYKSEQKSEFKKEYKKDKDYKDKEYKKDKGDKDYKDKEYKKDKSENSGFKDKSDEHREKKEHHHEKERLESGEEREDSKEARHNEPVTPEIAAKAEEFARALIAKMGFEAEFKSEIKDGELYIELVSDNSVLIGYHGEVLDSLEYLTGCIVNKEEGKFYRIIFDCNGYRDKRKESLISLANKMAAKCLKAHHKISLEPMNSNERKIIHSALADNDKVITRSEGHEPNRRVVILYKKSK